VKAILLVMAPFGGVGAGVFGVGSGVGAVDDNEFNIGF